MGSRRPQFDSQWCSSKFLSIIKIELSKKNKTSADKCTKSKIVQSLFWFGSVAVAFMSVLTKMKIYATVTVTLPNKKKDCTIVPFFEHKIQSHAPQAIYLEFSWVGPRHSTALVLFFLIVLFLFKKKHPIIRKICFTILLYFNEFQYQIKKANRSYKIRWFCRHFKRKYLCER